MQVDLEAKLNDEHFALDASETAAPEMPSISCPGAQQSPSQGGLMPSWPAAGSQEEADAIAAFEAMLPPNAVELSEGIYGVEPVALSNNRAEGQLIRHCLCTPFTRTQVA